MKELSMAPVGDRALCIIFGDKISRETEKNIRASAQVITRAQIAGVQEIMPTYCTLLICYDPMVLSYNTLCQMLKQLLEQTTVTVEERITKRVLIPVCYGGEYGPDLPDVAQHTGLTEQEVIECHAGRDYPISMLGFLPGFPYLSGLDPKLESPRLTSPRVKIEAGAVGIGGKQTGVYPLASPGGWRLIGRTPVKLFDPTRNPPVPYETGDLLRFMPITPEEYKKLEQGADNYSFAVEEVK